MRQPAFAAVRLLRTKLVEMALDPEVLGCALALVFVMVVHVI